MQLSRFCFQCAHLFSNCQGFAFNVQTSKAIVKVLQMCTPLKQLSKFCSQCAYLTSNCQGFFNVHTSQATVKVLLSMCTPHKQLSRFCSQCAHLSSNCQGFAVNVHTSQAIVKVLLSTWTPLKQLTAGELPRSGVRPQPPHSSSPTPARPPPIATTIHTQHTTQRYDSSPPTNPPAHPVTHVDTMRGPCAGHARKTRDAISKISVCRRAAGEMQRSGAHLSSSCQGFVLNVHTSQAIVKVLPSMCTPHKQLSRFCSQCAHLASNCQGFANVHTS